jgi:glutamate N-acetyltransferase/amino-acid N-acetyltransferase
VLVNSGQANAGIGPDGDRDAETSTAAVASALGIDASSVLACSTGVIGEPLHLGELLAAVPRLVASVSRDGGGAFAEAILTTDTRPKQAAAERGPYRIGGCAKGVGMIAPDLQLATMLAFVTTDASVPAAVLGRLATEVLEPAFGSLTVDGCSSTNDTVLLLASGAAGGPPIVPGTDAWVDLRDGIVEVADRLLEQLADDAEGATHTIVVDVAGATGPADARRIAKAVAGSPLVKTAVFGGDPNPGRILQAIGAAGVRLEPALVDATIGEVSVIAGGRVVRSGLDAARDALRGHDVRITISLGIGTGASRVLGVDLSYDYVKINAEYTT